MTEFFKTLRAYRRFLGFMLVFGTLAFAVNKGWISEGFIGDMVQHLSLIHISEPTRQPATARMPSSA